MADSTLPAPRWITYTRLSDFRSMPGNPKAHDLPTIMASVEAHGFTDPVEVCDRTGFVASGHGRVEALHALRASGYAGTPEGIVLDDDGEWCVPTQRGWASKDDDHLRAYVIGANHSGISGGWDRHALAVMMQDVATANADLLDSIGMTADDMDALLNVDPDQLDQGDGGAGDDLPGAAGEASEGRRPDPSVCCPDCGSVFPLSEGKVNDDG